MFTDFTLTDRQKFLKLNTSNSSIVLDHDLPSTLDSITVTMKICLDKYPVQYPQVYAQIKTEDNTLEEGYLATSTHISPSIWYTLALTYDSVSGEFKIYIDGVLSAVKVLSGNLDLSYFMPQLGIKDVAECTYAVRDLIFYDNAKSKEDLQDSPTSPTLDMISMWLFDEGTGTTVTDEVASYIGTLYNCSWVYLAGALRISPINSGVVLDHNVSESQTSIAVSMWVKLDKTTTISPTVYAQIKTASNTWEEGYLSTTTTLTPTFWYKLAFTYDNVTGVFNIYINDVIEATTTLSGNLVLESYIPQFGLEGIDNCNYTIKELIFFNSSQTSDELKNLNGVWTEVTDDMVSLWLFNETYGNITYDSIASYEGLLINCSWEQLETIGIYPKISRVVNIVSDRVLVHDAEVFEVGDTVFIVNPEDTSIISTHIIIAIANNVVTLNSAVTLDDTNLIMIKDYAVSIYPEFNFDSMTYSFDLFNYYSMSNPEIFVAVRTDIPKIITLSINGIKYKTTDTLTKTTSNEFIVFRVEIQDGGSLQPYYIDPVLYFDISSTDNSYALYIGEDTWMQLYNDTVFTSIKLEQWINIQEADAETVYLFGQLETSVTSFEDSYLESTTPLSLNTWYHIALTYNSIDGYLRLYINGELDTSALLEGEINNDRLIILGIAGTDTYTAIYDEIKIWKLGDVVENIHTKLSGTETDLVSYYELDTGSGTGIYDSSANYNHGTIIGNEFNWVISDIEYTSPYYSNNTNIQYIDKIIRDRFIFKPKEIASSEYLELYNTITRLRMSPDLYEERVDALIMYDYDKTVITNAETFMYNNIKLYKINHTTSNDIKLITANINLVDYRVTIVPTDGINIIDVISRHSDKLLAFVFGNGLIYIYMPTYFKHILNSITIYEN